MRCLFCGFKNRNKLQKCQSCKYFLNSNDMQEGLSYLESGFERIENELDNLEQKVHLVIGLIFKRHKYTSEDLQDSSQMDRIKSLAGKIKDDVSRWEAAGKFPYRLKMFYNENAELIQSRIRQINRSIQERKPTLWERIGGFLRKFYLAIVELLPVMFQRLLSGKNKIFLSKTA